MTEEPPRLDLTQPRRLGALISDSVRLYFRHFGRFLAIGAAVVVPAELIVSGVGLGELSGGFDANQPVAADLIPLAVQALVITPLIVAMTIYLLLDLSEGRPPGLRRAMQSGLDMFAPIFVPVLVALAAEALVTLVFVLPLALAVSSALVPTLVIPLALAVRWYFAPQAVVLTGERRLEALRASWELTRGSGWRVFGIVMLGVFAFTTATGLVASPIFAAARSADSGALVLVSRIVQETLAAPVLALLYVLLYFDLRARTRAAA